jgi:hypothetical protein
MKLHYERFSESQFDLIEIDSIRMSAALGCETDTLGRGTKFIMFA